MLITGGFDGTSQSNSQSRVTRYDRNGGFEDYPELNTGRKSHGCGGYMNSNQEKV